MSLLAFENVSKSYGATPALENVSLDIPAGKIVGLLGPNGSGKTTLIKLINGLLQPDQGRVLINDMDPSPATKAVVAYLPDTTYLNEQMKVKEALTYFKTFYKDFNLERAHHLLADLGIDENSRLKKLSKGNKEKVQLILVIAVMLVSMFWMNPLVGWIQQPVLISSIPLSTTTHQLLPF